ncbi:very short patch repair endonuclease [Limosilactobacillus balticus]|uniref:very short patch repair endonuclease n=1 Tax=Limosilactobacillus balticus TaxID=2759747 RepID=UPI0039962435
MTSPTRISNQMKKIHSKDTKPELILRKALWKEGIRYRKNYNGLIGKPDIAITSSKIAIFVDGEFWHGYNFADNKKRLHHNKEKWIKKIEKNMARDKKVNRILAKQGWKVMRYPSKYVINHTEECVTEIIQEIAYLK